MDVSHHALTSRDGRGQLISCRIHEGELGAAEGPTVDQTIENGGASGGGRKVQSTGGKQAPGGKESACGSKSVLPATHHTSDMFPQNLCVNTGAMPLYKVSKSQLAENRISRGASCRRRCKRASGCPRAPVPACEPGLQNSFLLSREALPNRDRRLF